MDLNNLMALTVAELKNKLREFNISITGQKVTYRIDYFSTKVGHEMGIVMTN